MTGAAASAHAAEVTRGGAPARAPGFLSDAALRLLFFGGKGGVGKTTCATATALARAGRWPDKRLLLVSVDPAHSILDALAGDAPPANLVVRELDAAACLAAFKRAHGEELREIARRGTFLDEDDIARFVDLSLPGMDEIFAFLEIAAWTRSGAYDCVIVDTAPTGHTLRLLATPEILRGWLDALDTMLAKHRYMKKLFSGAYRGDAADRLLLDLAASLRGAEELIRSAACRFVPVLLAEEPSLEETARLVAALRARSVPAGEILVNRMSPDPACDICRGAQAAQIEALARHRGATAGLRAFALPIFAREARGASDLSSLWSSVTPLDLEADREVRSGVAQRVRQPPPAVERAAALPPEGVRLILFAGKGGVGKTTLACATALHLGARRERPRVLVLSTDPAHSLGDCLGVPVGAEPTPIAPGVLAIALDAAAELERWRQRYLCELEQRLAGARRNLDFTFDRRVMERLWQLCPPGVDEIMALTRMGALLGEGRADLLVVDTAPTGHLLRLLEMPALLEQWIKALFSVVLKHKDVLNVPRFIDGLIELSRGLKALRALLSDARRAQVCAVSVPTRLAFEETGDLLAACARLGVAAPRLFLNLITPPGGCALCSALHAREQSEIQAFARAFPDVAQARIQRGAAPLGVGPLARLGAALHGGAHEEDRVDHES